MSTSAARRYLNQALTELAKLEPSHTADHVEMYIRDALIWMRDEPEHEARPPHPLTQIGRVNP